MPDRGFIYGFTSTLSGEAMGEFVATALVVLGFIAVVFMAIGIVAFVVGEA